MADFGDTKVRVGVRVKPGDTPPPGVTPTGSQFRIVHAGEGGRPDETCTASGVPEADGFTYCPEEIAFGSGDSLVITQTSAPAGLLVDKTEVNVSPVPGCNFFCLADPAHFEDAVARPPEAVDDESTTTVGESIDIDLLTNDDTASSGPVTDVTVTDPAHGTLSGLDVGAGTVTYTPAEGFVGTDTFTYTVTTQTGSSTATVTVEVAAPVVAPQAVDDEGTTTSDVPLEVDLLGNDDTGSGAVTDLTVTDPAHGTLGGLDVEAGTVTYTPADGFVGTDTFTYTVTTEDGSSTATVTILVEAAPTGPGEGPGGSDDGDSGGTSVLAATGADATTGPLALLGALLASSGAGLLLRRRRRPRGRHV